MFQEGASQVITATIASGGTTSGAVDVGSARDIGLIVPVTLTGATLAVHVGTTVDGTFYDSGVTVTPTAGVPSIAAADREDLRPFRFLKFVSASAEGAARTLYIVTKD